MNLFGYFCPGCGALYRDAKEGARSLILHRGVARSAGQVKLPTADCVPYHDYVRFDPCGHCCPDVFRRCQACRLGYPGAMEVPGQATEHACECHYCVHPPILGHLSAVGARAAVEAYEDAGLFDVFLCHNSKDKPVIRTIANRLLDGGVRPWLDEWETRPGQRWPRVLQEQLTSIRTAAVFVGESGLGPWQELEVESILIAFADRGTTPIPVLLPQAPGIGKLPLFLRGAQSVDFGVAVPDPIEQLIWGVTGVRRESL